MNNITFDQFMRYEKVRKSGKYNMIMEATDAMNEAKLSKEEYIECIHNYEKYYNAYIGC